MHTKLLKDTLQSKTQNKNIPIAYRTNLPIYNSQGNTQNKNHVSQYPISQPIQYGQRATAHKTKFHPNSKEEKPRGNLLQQSLGSNK